MSRDSIESAAALLRVHERLRGQGTVLDGERRLADVDYALKAVEETNVSTLRGNLTRDDSGAGRRNIAGIIKGPRAEPLAGYVGVRLALRLEDGRVLPFTIAKVLATRMFLVQGLGDVA